MRTDFFFARFFRKFPGAFFVVIGEKELKAKGYTFKVLEVKEQSFRLDGVFLPKLATDPIYFLEVQFRPKNDFYTRFMAKTAIFVQQQQPKNRWCAVAIFPRPSADPGVNHHYEEFFASGRIQRIYLSELPKKVLEKFPLNLLKIILDSKRVVIATAKKIVRQLPRAIPDKKQQDEIFEMLVNLLMSKLPEMTRKEVEQMFEPYLSDIRKSRAYREIAREGKREGKRAGRLEGKREVAKTLLQEKMSLSFVAKVTGFSPQEVRALKAELETRQN